MANFNKVMLIGNLTRDPETRFLPSGNSVCEFGLAVNRVWNDQQSGEKREQTCFVDCVAWGRQGETISRYMRKGRAIFVEGRLNYRNWETPEGQKRSKLDVVVETFQFLGDGSATRESGGETPPRSSARTAGSEGWDAPPSVSMESGAAMDDDVPF